MAQLDDVIDLVIPRGSNKLVSQIKESTKIPVLGHSGETLRAEICYIIFKPDLLLLKFFSNFSLHRWDMSCLCRQVG